MQLRGSGHSESAGGTSEGHTGGSLVADHAVVGEVDQPQSSSPALQEKEKEPSTSKKSVKS